MTQRLRQSGASSASLSWHSICWDKVESDVFRLQMRIAKAAKEKRWGKVQTLQRLLTRFHQAKLLAVRRVTSNKERNTHGVDGVI